MKSVVFESLFLHNLQMNKFKDIYDTFKKNFKLISLDQKKKALSDEQLKEYNETLTTQKILQYSEDLKDYTIIIIVNSNEEIKEYVSILGEESENNILFFTTNNKIIINNQFRENNYLGRKFRTVLTLDKFDKYMELIDQINKDIISAQEHHKNHNYDYLCSDYINLAKGYDRLNLINTSKNYYAYAAIAAERTEHWRKISYLWYCAYEPIKEKDYQDFNSLTHTYPSISFERWNKIKDEDKKGRALQYAAYSNDNHNGPTDSYWIYENAAEQYLEAENYPRAVECAVSATNRYSYCYHRISPKLMELWDKILENPKKEDNIELLYTSFYDIYKNLNLYNSDEAISFYIQAKKFLEKLYLKEKKYFKYMCSKIWWISTKYGTKISRIIILSLLLVLILFPMGYYLCDLSDAISLFDICSLDSFIDTKLFKNSIVTSLDVFFNINIPTKMSVAYHLITIFETFYAYIALIVISSGIISRILGENQ